MAKRKKKKPVDRVGPLEVAVEDLKQKLEDLVHQVEALSALPQREGSWPVKTFARFLDISTRTLENMIRDKRVPFHRFGGAIRFTPGDRERFLDETAQLPSPQRAQRAPREKETTGRGGKKRPGSRKDAKGAKGNRGEGGQADGG